MCVMRTTSDLLRLIDRFIAVTGYAETTVSLRIFNDGKRLRSFRARQRMYQETIDRSCEMLEDLIAQAESHSSKKVA